MLLGDEARGEIPLEHRGWLSREAFEVDAHDGTFFEVDPEAAGIEEQRSSHAEQGFVRDEEELGF